MEECIYQVIPPKETTRSKWTMNFSYDFHRIKRMLNYLDGSDRIELFRIKPRLLKFAVKCLKSQSTNLFDCEILA